jgi:hypothetical protein
MLNKIVVAWFQLVIFMTCFCLGCKPLCCIMQHLNILTIYNITYLIIYIHSRVCYILLWKHHVKMRSETSL